VIPQASAFQATEAAALYSRFFDPRILPDFTLESPTYDARDGTEPQFRKHYDSKTAPSSRQIVNKSIFLRRAGSSQILPDLVLIEEIMAELRLF
jgi:hypothetical protein